MRIPQPAPLRTEYDPRFRRTKIVATIGPASGTPEVLGRMLDAGVDVVRINSSHGTPAERATYVDLVRRVATDKGRHTGILVDLQGPRIRVGVLPESRHLAPGARIVFAPEGEAAGAEIPTTYAQLADDVTPGTRILLDDGLLAVTVEEVDGSKVVARVVYGGELRSNKGMNLPGLRVSAPAVTEKDQEDIERAVAQGVEYIGISFVSRAEDVESVRQLVPPAVRLIAKIERTAALAELPLIVQTADAVMVARGDLGVELPYEEVPLAQKRLIRLANRRGRPVITATQMLESMMENPRPTRAEASDVANAILDGTDAVMLSGETSIGKFPVEAVEAMARIAREIERSLVEDPTGQHRRRGDVRLSEGTRNVEDAIAVASTAAAEMLRVPVILSFTKSGFTARKISAYRPAVPIVALSTEASTCRQLALVWGVWPELADRMPTYDAMLETARDTLIERGYARAGDLIVVTAGVPFEVPGTTNLLKIEVV